MDDRTLADAIVGFGVGAKTEWLADVWRYWMPDDPIRTDMPDFTFVRDWRVAGAMMELWLKKSYGLNCYQDGEDESYISTAELAKYRGISKTDKSLPRAINLACVEALRA